MARKKPDTLYPVKDTRQANQVLAELAALQRNVADVERRLNDDIDRRKAQAEAEAAPYRARIQAMENGLQAFAEHRKEELFSNRRSVELDFGTLGYRRSHEVKPKPRTTWAQVLGKLKELRFHEAVRVKEAVDKDELRSWPDERLESVGARRVQKDTFWYEINAQKVAEEAA